ncbi:GNAT family N-acetyltransferase [Candidatus Woesearchaeota archaeon]|nr:GNAT family N-acetyltransferase [Candidatus Woesearchaeota archaeon]
MMLQEIPATSQDFNAVWHIYEEAFPKAERRSLAQQVQIMSDPAYHLHAVHQSNGVIGLLAEWNLSAYEFIEHFAVHKKHRSKGIGSAVLEQYLGCRGRPVVIEVEPPVNEESRRHIRFWERNGFVLNLYNYIQPSYGKGKEPVRMYLMTTQPLEEARFGALRDEMHKTAYGLAKPLLNMD